MRKNEFKLRQKEAGNPDLTTSQKQEIKRLKAGGASKKIINTMFGTSYQQLKGI